MQFCHDAFFPPWSVTMGPWYPFSYMIAMIIDLYGQLLYWFILWIIIHAYEADRSCVNTMTIDMNSKDCWYEHVIVNMNINITQMNECSTPWTTNVIQMNWWSLIWKSTFTLDQLTLSCHHERFHNPYSTKHQTQNTDQTPASNLAWTSTSKSWS